MLADRRNPQQCRFRYYAADTCSGHKVPSGNERRYKGVTGQGEDEFISRVSVFDAHCAGVYLTEKTDVAFRPFGLDLFDMLVRACKGVREQLEKEQRLLASNGLATVQAQIPDGTAVAKLLANVTSLTKPQAVRGLSRLSVEEESRVVLLDQSLLDLQANDPEKLIRQLTLRAARIQALARHIKDLEEVLSEGAVNAVFNARTEDNRKNEEAERLRATTFPARDLGWDRFGILGFALGSRPKVLARIRLF